ncbi:MAG: deaminase [Pseudodesulfovibrio sp.]|nr:deaminase [Pseudodesulfovibrio sp.]
MEFIHASKACASVGPYSHAVKAGDTYYLSGQVPFHPVSGTVVGSNIAEQAAQTFANLSAVLDEAGLKITDIVKATVFLKNWDDFESFNEVYSQFVGDHRPARVCVEVSNIASGCLIEMDAICVKLSK